MKSDFIGNSICCGTYSLIHLLERDIDVDLFELTTGVPFGIRGSIEEGRLLTTYINPNYGLETGMQIWGIHGRKFSYKDKQHAWHKLIEILECYNQAIVGPLNMLTLTYYPLSTLNAGMDHYIYIRKSNTGQILIKDSEGYLAISKSEDIFYKMWEIHNVREAEGEYTFRLVTNITERNLSRIEFLQKAYDLMTRNIINAESACHGSHVFPRIIKYTENTEIGRWKTSMMYDFTHLLQRKINAKQMLTELSAENDLDKYKKILKCLDEQIEILPFLYRNVEEGNVPSRILLMDMAKTERRLYELLKI